jgi:hypothetical protein
MHTARCILPDVLAGEVMTVPVLVRRLGRRLLLLLLLAVFGEERLVLFHILQRGIANLRLRGVVVMHQRSASGPTGRLFRFVVTTTAGMDSGLLRVGMDILLSFIGRENRGRVLVLLVSSRVFVAV